MDTIWNCAFGVDLDMQNNPSNEYYEMAEKFFNDVAEPNFLIYFGSMMSKSLGLSF